MWPSRAGLHALAAAASEAQLSMANEAAKKRVIQNKAIVSKWRLILLGTNVRARQPTS